MFGRTIRATLERPSVNSNALPEFSDPPLHEVAISVQFEPLDRLVVPEIGLLWQHYGSRFSHVEQHPTIEPAIERFGVKSIAAPPRLRLIENLPLPRVWFLSERKTELLQIQQDRFIRNWRRLTDEDQYPRYVDHIRPRFVEDLKDFYAFLEANEIGKIVPNQCEVTYVNHIRNCDLWRVHSEMAKVFACWSSDYVAPADCEIEDMRFQIKHLIKKNGEPVGRLYIIADPAFLGVDDEPIFSLKMVARGKPLAEDIEGVLAFVDLGRESIVRAFANVTRTEVQMHWGRTD